MITLPLAEARNNLSRIVDDVERTHDAITITRNGTPAAVVISVDDYESLLETFALLEDSDEQQRLREAEESVASGDVATADEMAALLRDRETREGST